MMRIAPILVLLGTLLMLPAYGAPDIQVFNYSSYINSSGLPVVVGEVINDGKEAVKSVEVKVNFLGTAGELIDSSSGIAAVDTIPPGQRSPFMVFGSADYADTIASYQLEIVNFANSQNKPAMLQVVSASQFSDGTREVSIWGQIMNMGSDTATSTKVHATFYDDDGRAIGYSSASADPGTIEPNDKTAFEIKTYEMVSSIQSYTLFAESDQYSVVPFGVQSVNNPLDAGNKVGLSKLSVVDQEGNNLGKFAPGERVWIKSDLKNRLPNEEEFTYIVQIKNADGFPVTVSWVDGALTPDMTFSPSLSWVPDEEGIYYAEIFVWHSMDNPVPLTSSIRTIILLVKA